MTRISAFMILNILTLLLVTLANATPYEAVVKAFNSGDIVTYTELASVYNTGEDLLTINRCARIDKDTKQSEIAGLVRLAVLGTAEVVFKKSSVQPSFGSLFPAQPASDELLNLIVFDPNLEGPSKSGYKGGYSYEYGVDFLDSKDTQIEKAIQSRVEYFKPVVTQNNDLVQVEIRIKDVTNPSIPHVIEKEITVRKVKSNEVVVKLNRTRFSPSSGKYRSNDAYYYCTKE